MPQTQTSTAAILSLVFGIGSFCLGFLAGIPAVIAGVIGLSKINQSGERLTGRGMAIAGITLGCTGSVLQIGLMVALLLPAVQAARDAARRAKSSNNLRQIGLAMHNYHDAYLLFPPGGIYNAKGRPYHSWETMLLPYLEHAHVYKTIDFNYPWDDAKNANAFKSTVPPFLQPDVSEIIDSSGFALSHYSGNSQFFGKNSRLRFGDLYDGSSYTIMAGEGGKGFKPWGDPSNLRDPALGLNQGSDSFGRPSGLGAQFLFADGSVRFFNNEVDRQILNALATPRGGENVAIPGE